MFGQFYFCCLGAIYIMTIPWGVVNSKKSAHTKQQQQNPSKTSCRGLLPLCGHFLGTLCSVCVITSLSSLCAQASHLSQVVMNALTSPWSKQLGEKGKQTQQATVVDLFIWAPVFQSGLSPLLRAWLANIRVPLARKKKTKQTKKHRWKYVNSPFSIFVIISSVKTRSSLCGSSEPAGLDGEGVWRQTHHDVYEK